MARITDEIEIKSNDDCLDHLRRISKEMEKIVDHIYMIESHDDTVKNEATEQIKDLGGRVEDAITDLVEIANDQMI